MLQLRVLAVEQALTPCQSTYTRDTMAVAWERNIVPWLANLSTAFSASLQIKLAGYQTVSS